jgi:hypothetical protein
MKHVLNNIQTGLIALVALFVIASCSNDAKKRNAADATSALVQQNKNIVAFGHVSFTELLNKMGYQSIPKANIMISAQMATWKKGFKLNHPLYFAAEAPLAKNGVPSTIYALMDITSSDSLENVFSEMGYSMEKEGEITYFQEDDITFGMRNHLFILISKRAPYDGKALLTKAFQDSEGDLSEGKTQKILAHKADIVTGIALERLYTTANTSLNTLSDSKKTELTQLVSDGFIQASVNFTNGKAVFETKNLFSNDLKNRLFFKETTGKGLVSKLGGGKPWMGIAANIDVRKMEQLISDFAPEVNRTISNQLPSEAGFMLMALGNNAYSSLFSGQFGLVTTGNAQSADGLVLEYNAFLGLGSKGDGIRGLLENVLATYPKNGDAYVMDNVLLRMKSDGIYASAAQNSTNTKLALPPYANDFGKKTFSAFIAFDQINVESLELGDQFKALELMKSLVITADKNGAKIVLTSKSSQGNILKQIADFYLESMKERINELAF